jgi:hypothetical protein
LTPTRYNRSVRVSQKVEYRQQDDSEREGNLAEDPGNTCNLLLLLTLSVQRFSFSATSSIVETSDDETSDVDPPSSGNESHILYNDGLVEFMWLLSLFLQAAFGLQLGHAEEPPESLHTNIVRVINIEGDGHCAFSAVAAALKESFGVEVTTSELRNECKDYLSEHSHEVPEGRDDNSTWEKICDINYERPAGVAFDLQSYMNSIRRNLWGGFAEFKLLTTMYQVNILVYGRRIS